MQINSMMRLGLMQAGGAAAPPPTYAAPYEEPFAGTLATLLSTKTVNGAAWTYDQGHVVLTNVVAVTGTGEAYSTNNAGNGAFTWTYFTMPVADEQWHLRRLSPFGTSITSAMTAWAQEVAYIGPGNIWDKINFSPSGVGNQQLILRAQAGIAANAVPTTREATSNVYVEYGDSIEVRKRKVGATILYDHYHNGRKVKVGTFDVAALGLTYNGRIGVGGAIATLAQRQLSDVLAGDPATHAMIRVDRPARVAQLNDDGSLTLHLEGDYSLAAPGALKATVLKGTDESTVSGYASVAMTALTTGSNRWTATLDIAAADVTSAAMKTTGFIVRVERHDLIGGGFAYDHTCLQYAGEVAIGFGQSLWTMMTLTTQSALTQTGWVGQGCTDLSTAVIDRRYTRGLNNKATAKLNEIFAAQSGVSDKSIAVIATGKGGTDVTERVVGGSIWTADYVPAMSLGGSGFGCAIIVNGQYEITDGASHYGGTFNSGQQTTFKNSVLAQLAAMETVAGRALGVVVVPVGAVQGGTDSKAQAVRRTQWELLAEIVAANGSRVAVRGPMTADLQHTDIYHLNAAGYLEQSRRLGFAWAKARGFISVDREGPTLDTVTRNSATQVVVRFNLNGATSIELTNYAYASDARGGLTFATDSAFASPVSPNAAPTIGTPSGGFCDVTFDFAGSSFPGTVYVRGPYGSNPFNRANDATINADMAGKASVWRGVYSGGASDVAPIQPYFHSSGNDYLSDS